MLSCNCQVGLGLLCLVNLEILQISSLIFQYKYIIIAISETTFVIVARATATKFVINYADCE